MDSPELQEAATEHGHHRGRDEAEGVEAFIGLILSPRLP
jgi:hypothetical protein